MVVVVFERRWRVLTLARQLRYGDGALLGVVLLESDGGGDGRAGLDGLDALVLQLVDEAGHDGGVVPGWQWWLM